MARFYGKIGYITTSETSPGVWEPSVVERYYYGDVRKMSRQWNSGSGVNDNLEIRNEISIIADAFALNNFQSMKYIEWMGANWKISNVTVERPRLILSIGGVYNG